MLYVFRISFTASLLSSSLPPVISAFPRTLYKTTRLEKVHRHGVRSKFVVRPEFVVEVSSF